MSYARPEDSERLSPSARSPDKEIKLDYKHPYAPFTLGPWDLFKYKSRLNLPPQGGKGKPVTVTGYHIWVPLFLKEGGEIIKALHLRWAKVKRAFLLQRTTMLRGSFNSAVRTRPLFPPLEKGDLKLQSLIHLSRSRVTGLQACADSNFYAQECLRCQKGRGDRPEHAFLHVRIWLRCPDNADEASLSVNYPFKPIATYIACPCRSTRKSIVSSRSPALRAAA